MSDNRLKVVKTADGFDSLFHEGLNERYHSMHGAKDEAMHVFIKHGLWHMSARKSTVKVLEVGFGTGLNLLLTYLNKGNEKTIQYSTIEAFPIGMNKILELNYVDMIGEKGLDEIFNKLHHTEWEKWHSLDQDFEFVKYATTLDNFQGEELYDVIYFDAFAPDVQPEMWTEEVFRKMYGFICNEGVLVTYCAKGVVKRNLKAAGFTVESLPGPPGKREMTRAVKLNQ